VLTRQSLYDSVVSQEERKHFMLGSINLRSVMLFVVLGTGVASQAIGQAALSAENGHSSATSTAPDKRAAAAHNHSVKLSWRASIPASKLPRDAVIGYNVYRSTTSHDRRPRRINAALCAGTTYVDPEVEPGQMYFYVTRGVTAKGVESSSSNETRVVIPSP
jgi:hypothetical protein